MKEVLKEANAIIKKRKKGFIFKRSEALNFIDLLITPLHTRECKECTPGYQECREYREGVKIAVWNYFSKGVK